MLCFSISSSVFTLSKVSTLLEVVSHLCATLAFLGHMQGGVLLSDIFFVEVFHPGDELVVPRPAHNCLQIELGIVCLPGTVILILML